MSRGFSIIEFMIAITLGTLLVASAGAIYLSNKTTYRVQEGLARLQESGRYATYILNHEIRMAGYQGCASDEFVNMNNLISSPSYAHIYSDSVKGFEGSNGSFSPSLPTNLSGKPVDGTDVIEIRMAKNTNVQLRDDMNQTNNPLLVYDRLGIQAGEAVMISNCQFGDIFIAGGNTNATAITHTSSNNQSNHLTTAYTSGAHVMRYVYYAYYIKDTGRTNEANQPIYTLVRQDQQGNEEELVDGVQQMQIEYGVDTNQDNTADTFQSASQVNNANNWGNVISIKMNLLLATLENVSPQVVSYEFNGTTYTDRRLRREWQTYITIRNRGLPT